MSATTCRSCGAPIVWAKSSVSGKSIPLDAAEVEFGPGAMLLDAATTATPGARVQGEPEPPVGTWHLSHFATCRDANAWRKS